MLLRLFSLCLLYTVASLAIVLQSHASSLFELDFEGGSARAKIEGVTGQEGADPEVEPAFTVGGGGLDGEAAIIAGESLQSFASQAGEPEGALIRASYGLRYSCPVVLNPQQGEIRFSFRPSYNGTYTQAEGSENASRLYYLFDSGRFDPNGSEERQGGIQMLLKHSKIPSGDAYVLNVVVALENGEIIKQANSVAANPDEWHSIRLMWTEDSLTLVFNERTLFKKEIAGPLTSFEEHFTLGGSWYGTWPLQGGLDSVQIIGGH